MRINILGITIITIFLIPIINYSFKLFYFSFIQFNL